MFVIVQFIQLFHPGLLSAYILHCCTSTQFSIIQNNISQSVNLYSYHLFSGTPYSLIEADDLSKIIHVGLLRDVALAFRDTNTQRSTRDRKLLFLRIILCCIAVGVISSNVLTSFVNVIAMHLSASVQDFDTTLVFFDIPTLR